MTRTGIQYLEGIRDGRAVFIDGERVDDVTTHPAFADAALSVANLYDRTNDPSLSEKLTFVSPKTNQPVNIAYMIPKTAEDLRRRRIGLRLSAEGSFGLMGRSPDHVACFLAGFAGNRELFDQGGTQFGDNLVAFYERMRDEDQYVTYVIAPPQIDRSKSAHEQEDPHLYAGIVDENDDGIVVRGAQMMGTGAAIADWIYVSNIVPLRPGDEAYAFAAAVPLSAKGLKVYSRRSYASAASSHFDYPLSTRFDETDSLIVFDDVLIPWSEVFIHKNVELARDQWWKTSAHVLGNNQAQIRFSTKLDLLAAVARETAEMNQSVQLPPIQGVLGELAAYAAMVHAVVLAQESNPVIDEHGVAWPNPQFVHAISTLQIEFYPKLINIVRELCGGGLIQLPSSVKDYANDEIAADLERYVQSPGFTSEQRVKLLKFAWDLVGSEFASRHQQYELFYAGAPHLVRARMFRHFNFDRGAELLSDAMAGYDTIGRLPGGSVRAELS